MRDPVLIDESSKDVRKCGLGWVGLVVFQELLVVDLEPSEECLSEVGGVIVRRRLRVEVLGVGREEVHLCIVVQFLKLELVDGLRSGPFFSLG